MSKVIQSLGKRWGSQRAPKLDTIKFSTWASFGLYTNIAKEICKVPELTNTWAGALQTLKTSTAVQSYLFNTKIQSHLDLKNVPVTSFQGKAIIRDEPQKQGEKPSLRIAEQEEIDQATTFAISGIGGDDPRQVSALLKYAKLLASKHPYSKDYLPLAIFPEVNQEKRYKDAVEYTLHSDYYPPYIQQRVEEFLLPKVLKNLVSEEISKTSLLSFSMGGREVMMMQTALRDILAQQFYLPKVTIDTLMSDITAICVGYAPNVEAFKDTGFKKIVIFSIDDRGVLIPHDLYEFTLTKKSLLNSNLVIKQMHQSSEAYQYLVITGEETVSPCPKDPVDHTISHYFDCIEKMPEDLITIIGDGINSSDEL